MGMGEIGRGPRTLPWVEFSFGFTCRSYGRVSYSNHLVSWSAVFVVAEQAQKYPLFYT
jgi:hypothetical protein